MKHPQNYPGKHLSPQPRSSSAYKPMEPKAQMHIIVTGLKKFIKEKMLQGKGVVIKNFGGFTFEVKSENKVPAQLFGFDPSKTYSQLQKQRKNIHKLRPCFLVEKKFGDSLARFANKSQVDAPNSQTSVFQKGYNMLYCNAGPIASACSLDRESTQSALDAIIQAIIDLTNLSISFMLKILGFDLDLDFGVAKLTIRNKDLKTTFSQNFVSQLNTPDFEDNVCA